MLKSTSYSYCKATNKLHGIIGESNGQMCGNLHKKYTCSTNGVHLIWRSSND